VSVTLKQNLLCFPFFSKVILRDTFPLSVNFIAFEMRLFQMPYFPYIAFCYLAILGLAGFEKTTGYRTLPMT
jgi:hypothetical protein